MTLLVKCAYVNATENHMIGKEDVPQEAFTNDRGELYRSCQKEYGRCVSKMYRDHKDGRTEEIGWVFQGRDRYQDSRKTYLREVWVEVIEQKADND
jgi:hypothetical protein